MPVRLSSQRSVVFLITEEYDGSRSVWLPAAALQGVAP